MSLPQVRVHLTADGRGEVFVNDEPLAGVLAVTVVGAVGDLPRVIVTLRPGDITADLPEAGVQLLQAGPDATAFAAQVDPRRLERDALQHLDDCPTQGEAFAAALRAQAADFDDRG